MTMRYSETPGRSNLINIANILSLQAGLNPAKPNPKLTQQRRPLSKAYVLPPLIYGGDFRGP